MRKQLSAAALILTMAFSAAAYADTAPAGKEGMDGGPYKEALSKLPDKDATLLRDAMKQAHEQNKAAYDQIHQLHADMKAIMIAPKFDKDAYLAKEMQAQKLEDKVRANTRGALVSALAQLPQDERKTLSEAFEQRHEKHHWHHDHDKNSSDNAAQ